MNGQTQTWRQVLQQRGQHSLIGRQHEYEVFRLNFIYQVPEYLIFTINGPTGIGKTSLLMQYQAIAQEHGAITPLINAAQLTAVPEQTLLQILVSLARQLAQANTQVTTFDERYRQYTETLQMITTDSTKPAGVFDFMKGLAQPETAAAWDAYLYEKSLPPDQISLLKNPVETLTRALVKDLTAWATIRRIILCFDDWELLEPQIGEWLRAILAPGELNTNVWLLIAGVEPPDEAWAPFRALTLTLPLQAFTTEETHTYLNACGLTDPARLSHIWSHSRGVPLWVSMLASARSPHIEGLALNSTDRYLKWLAEPWQRETAVRCAAARYLNADIVRAVTGHVEAFAWLSQTPLVSAYADGWRYQPILQTQLRELARMQFPASLETAYTALRAYYARRIVAYNDEPRYRDPEWQRDQLEHLYYGLMLNDVQAEREGLALFIFALRAYAPLAGEVVRTWQQAAAEQPTPNAITDWADTLKTAWRSLERREWSAGLILCDLLMHRNDLSYDAQEELHIVRTQLEIRTRVTAPIGADSARPPAEPPIVKSIAPASPPERIAPAPVTSAPVVATPAAESFAVPAAVESAAPPQVERTSDIHKQVERGESEFQGKEPPFKEPGEVPVAAAPHYVKQEAAPVESESPAAEVVAEPTVVEVAAEPPPPEAPVEPPSAQVSAEPPTAEAPEPPVPQAPVELPASETPAPPSAEEVQEPAPTSDKAEPEGNEAIIDATDYTNRGNVYLNMGEYQKAIHDYTRALELNPAHTTAYYNRALAFTQIRGFDHAVEDYTRAIEINPQLTAAYKNRGVIYASVHEYQRAIADYTQALALNPADSATYNNRGNAYYNLKEYPEALADYDRAIEHDPHHARAYLNRGLVYAAMDEYQQAIADYNQAILLNANNAAAYNHRGQAYARLEQYTQALADYDKALELAPKTAIFHNNRGLVLVKLRRYADAIEAYQRASAVNPQYATAYYNAACAAALMGNAREACAWLEKAIALHPQYQIMAKHDADFQSIAGNIKFRNLVNPPA